MAFKVIDRLFLVAYGTEDPSDAEWAIYLRDIERHGIERTLQLIYTEGSGPSATQRRDLKELLDGRAVPVAVMSSSAAVRGMVTAMSWFNTKIRAFAPADLGEALAYLEIPTSRAELIERELAGLRLSLGHADAE